MTTSTTATTTRTTAANRAVLAAAGEARNDASAQLSDAVRLMSRAVDAALAGLDPSLRERIGVVAATVGSDDSPDPAGAVAQAIGAHAATTVVAAIGVTQQRLVSHAINAVRSGRADAVLVLGGEAKASALTAKRNGQEPPSARTGPGAAELFEPDGEFMAETEVAASLWDPVTQYALIDSALALHERRSPAQLLEDVSELWARFDAVAGANPTAAFAGPPHTAGDLARTSDENRLLAFPYNKWHSTQWTIDHAAALLVCSEELALAAGATRDSLLHPLVALDSSWGLTLTRRAEPHRWPTMEIMGARAEKHLGHPLADTDLIELYSCFPAAVRVQQRALGLPTEGTPTVTGGMAFAGGPFNHFTYMATAEIHRRLSRSEADSAAITSVSGMLTKGGLMVWGREPHRLGPLIDDVGGAARQATDTVAVAPWDPARHLASPGSETAGDRLVAATITGGLRPTLFALTEDRSGVSHLVAQPAPEGDPAAVLSRPGWSPP